MTKEEFLLILRAYQNSEEIKERLSVVGVDIDSQECSYYSNVNYVIFKLIGHIFGEKNQELIEEYLFKQTDISFNDLWEIISK